MPDALSLSRGLVKALVLPSGIAHCGVAEVQTRPAAMLMEDSDACRQNCDKVVVKAQHSLNPKLCKGVLRGDTMRGPHEYAFNTPHTSYTCILQKAASCVRTPGEVPNIGIRKIKRHLTNIFARLY